MRQEERYNIYKIFLSCMTAGSGAEVLLSRLFLIVIRVQRSVKMATKTGWKKLLIITTCMSVIAHPVILIMDTAFAAVQNSII